MMFLGAKCFLLLLPFQKKLVFRGARPGVQEYDVRQLRPEVVVLGSARRKSPPCAIRLQGRVGLAVRIRGLREQAVTAPPTHTIQVPWCCCSACDYQLLSQIGDVIIMQRSFW